MLSVQLGAQRQRRATYHRSNVVVNVIGVIVRRIVGCVGIIVPFSLGATPALGIIAVPARACVQYTHARPHRGNRKHRRKVVWEDEACIFWRMVWQEE